MDAPAGPQEAPAKRRAPRAAAGKTSKGKAGAGAGAAAPEPEAGASLSDGFEVSTILDHARTKGMWAGEVTPVPNLGWLTAGLREGGGLRFAPLTLPHTPALLTAINEVLVNACDQAKATMGARGGTRAIDVAFDAATGRVSVYNNGPGVPVAVHAAESRAAGAPVYTVELAFARFLAGSNIVKSLGNVKGGINGLGAKLANAHSASFLVETVDAAAGLAYRQAFHDRLRRTDPPEVAPRAAGAAPFTRVSFTPAYAELGYGGAAPDPARAADIGAWLRWRCLQTAAYLGPRVAVTFNGEACATRTAGDLARALLAGEAPDAPAGAGAGSSAEAPPEPGAQVFEGKAKADEAPYSAHPWDVAVIVLPPGQKAARRGADRDVAVVNGVNCGRGSHLKHVRELLAAEVAARYARLQKKGKDEPAARTAELLAGVRIVFCGAVPGADWGSQGKAELKLGAEVLGRWSFSAAFLARAAQAVVEGLAMAAGRGPAKRFVHDKYTRARNAGGARRRDARLLAAEGDSALTFLRAGLTQGRRAPLPGGPSLDWCGLISLQGVVMNAARQVKEVTCADGRVAKVASASLDKNVRLLALQDALGLRRDRAYATPEERAALPHGSFVLCVDQDHDGVGKIASLVLVWLHTFWPALLRAGYVGRFMTPLVRAYPRAGRGEPVEFYYEAAFERWLEAEPGREKAFRVKYYKGLATHDDDEVARMFAPGRFERNIFAFTYDEVTDRLFQVYFGADAALRKVALATPVEHLEPEAWAALEARRELPLGAVQLAIDTKAYKLDAISRQIPGAVDGLVPVHRKIVARPLQKELKVYQHGGRVAAELFYHHGDASLSASIISLAQAFPGARRFPLLRGVGQFGGRHARDDAGSPRYISVAPSAFAARALPAADRWHLPYVFVEGARAEPASFVPVAPLAVLESFAIVSEGWNHCRFARALGPALAAAEAFARGDAALAALGARLHAEGATPAARAEAEALLDRFPLPAETQGFLGPVRLVRGVETSFGSYSLVDLPARTVRVVDLPIGVVTEAFLEDLVGPKAGARASALVEAVDDFSTQRTVDLAVRFRPGALERVLDPEGPFGGPEVDPIEDALGLYQSLAPALNFVGASGAVLELPAGPAGYLAALAYWGVARRDLYRVRLERELAQAELRAAAEDATLRYIAEESGRIGLASLADDAAAEAALAARGFPRFDLGLIRAPRYASAAELRRLAAEGPGAGYAYLLRLRGRDLVAAAAARRAACRDRFAARAAGLRAALAEDPPGSSVWLAELAAFRAAAEAGPEAGACLPPPAAGEDDAPASDSD